MRRAVRPADLSCDSRPVVPVVVPRAPSLDEATQDLVAQTTQSNAYLRPTGSRRRETINGAPAR